MKSDRVGGASDDADGPGLARTKPARFAIGSVLFVLSVGLALLRPSGTRAWRSIFAEDGAIYFQQAHDHGAFAVMFRGYAGYLQLPPRLLGAVSTLAPTQQLSVWLAVSGTIVCALLAWFAYWSTRGLIHSRLVRLVLAGFVVFMPAMGFENTATITNTIWSFLAVAPLALISTADRPGDVVARCVIVFLAATSSALALLYLPLAVGWALWRRTLDAVIVAGVFGAGLVLQTAVVLRTQNDTSAVHRSVARLADVVGIRVFAEYLVGDKGIGAFWGSAARSMSVLAPLIVIAVFGLLVSRVRARRRVVVGALALYGVLFFVVAVWGRGTNAVLVSSREPVMAFVGRTLGVASSHAGEKYISSALRYSVVPVFLLGAAFAVLVGGSSESATRVSRVGKAIFVVHIVALSVIGFSVAGARSDRLDWTKSLNRTFTAHCAGRDPDTRVAVPTEPAPFNEYAVTLRCREIKTSTKARG